MKIFRFLGNKERIYIAISLIFIVVQVWLDLKMPSYMAAITKTIQTPGSVISDVVTDGMLMLLCAFGSLLSTLAVGYFAAVVAAGFAKTLREKLFDRVNDFSEEEMNNFSTPSLITRTTNDITQVQVLIAFGLQLAVKAPILAVWAMLKISNKSWQWTAATAVAVITMLLLIFLIFKLVVPRFKLIQRYTDDVNRVMREQLNGLKVIRAFNAENYQQIKFEKVNSNLTGTQLFAQRTMGLIFPSMGMILNLLTLSIYWIGAILITNEIGSGRLTLFSDMIVFTSYAMQVVMAFMMLGMILIQLPRTLVSIHRINEVLDTKPKIIDGNLDTGELNEVGTVEFKNVCFGYPGAEEYVLEGINFKVNKGETVAFIGSTGCGKSTLVNLVPRFYDVTKGEILINGHNVKEYRLNDLHKKLGYVSQKAVIFTGDIKKNVGYGDNNQNKTNEETENSILDALEIAMAKEFVDAEPEGIFAPVSQSGANYSGGQKQRLSIARAINRNPEILIFDDSFSALDYRTDRALRNALKDKIKDTTVMIVGQRIGTIKEADRIVVLEKGKIAGMGTHKELLKNCEVYLEIAKSQLSEKELEVS
ncbi:MAG TPA: ABC transporter ATP-binding protein [Anaerovoracaceae bacterium]|nr:ABC transporter ATP-binding protein [Anaerovoracaceae bacterium]